MAGKNSGPVPLESRRDVMAEIDKHRAAVARMIVHETFGREYKPATDVSGVTSDPINQVQIAQRMNTAGKTVTFGTDFRWTNVDPGDIAKVTLFGHFYGLAYAHLSKAVGFEPEDAKNIVDLLEAPFEIGGVE
jgi:hypothetical protein